MSLGIKVYQIQDFIRKNEVGAIDSDRCSEIIQNLSTATSFHSDSNLLLDLRQTTVSVSSFDDMAAIAEEFIHVMPSFKNKMAVLIPDEPERIHTAKKLELCMRKKNLTYKIFTVYESAIEWLSHIQGEK